MTTFISYSGDLSRVQLLVRTLRRYGLRTWRDQTSLDQGAATEAAIEDELERCDAAMIWLGGNTLVSEFVRKVELPLIFKHHATRGLRIVPLFVDVDIPTAADAIRDATGDEIASHNGYSFDPEEPLATNLAAAADREVLATLRKHAQASAVGRPSVRFVTRSDAASGRNDADLNFDWINEYPADGARPDPTTVADLRTALHASSQHLISAFGAGSVDLHVTCHLHLGVALGFEFRRVTGLRPRLDVDGSWWNVDTAAALDETQRLAERVTNGPVGSNRVALELSVTRDVHAMVNDYVAESGTAYRKRVQLQPSTGPNQQAVTAANLNAWCEQAADALRALRSLPGIDAADVFMATPITFAVAFGWRLNAIGSVNLFHPMGNAGPYQAVWTLPDT